MSRGRGRREVLHPPAMLECLADLLHHLVARRHLQWPAWCRSCERCMSVCLFVCQSYSCAGLTSTRRRWLRCVVALSATAPVLSRACPSIPRSVQRRTPRTVPLSSESSLGCGQAAALCGPVPFSPLPPSLPPSLLLLLATHVQFGSDNEEPRPRLNKSAVSLCQSSPPRVVLRQGQDGVLRQRPTDLGREGLVSPSVPCSSAVNT